MHYSTELSRVQLLNTDTCERWMVVLYKRCESHTNIHAHIIGIYYRVTSV